MSANVENSTTQVVVCSNCQTKNRVPAVAHGVPRCGKCHTPLRWVVNGPMLASLTLWRPRPFQCWSTCGHPGAVPAGW
jgi:ribosomal protein L37AE/L43A